ncbi:MAG: DUF2961 domain-containing protein [Acidobacteria bacterium]|nr:DUF2961 domain-containing protein [Acidobacteriota bacterium]
MINERRSFFARLLGWGTFASAAAAQPPARTAGGNPSGLGNLFLARSGRRRRESSWDRSGKNADRLQIAAGQTATFAELRGAGCIRHVWITIASNEPDYLRRLVLRAYWDGEPAPSIETPVGDFFGVGHGRVSNYWSVPLNMVTGGNPERQNRAAMNCWFPMPFANGARFTVENQGQQPVNAFYFYVDYEEYDSLPREALRFHAMWRREHPTRAAASLSQPDWNFRKSNDLVNLDGKQNYLIFEAEGRGHYVGCNVSVDHINPIPNFTWFGEGDDMMYIDGEAAPSLVGTGTEDYFCAAWGFPSGFYSAGYHGISLAGATEGPDSYSGKWTMFRYHVEDPVMFTKSIRVTIEHGHANVHANDYSSVGYWYQTEPHKRFPALLPVEARLPLPPAESLRQFWKTR